MFKRNSFKNGVLFVLMMALLVVGVNVQVDAMGGKPVEEAQSTEVENEVKAPKYVFYFIGDGMGFAQRQVSEYYLQHKTGNDKAKLTMSEFPIAGINTTHAADTLITGSGSAATALATGNKTNNKMIAMNPQGKSVKTVIEEARDRGMATGLISTARLTHATPAAFASHVEHRSEENEIANQYVDSNVDFFAGGGYRHFISKAMSGSKREDNRDLTKEFNDKGYNVFISEDDTNKFRDYNPNKGDQVFAAFTASHLSYEIDRDEAKEPSIAEITAKGIELLSQSDNGFMMMIEGGRIDHAAHVSDLAGTIQDTLAFDEAIATAYEFYKRYPEETLIVVAGDHETGGLALNSCEGMEYDYFLDLSLMDSVNGSVGALSYDGDRKKLYNTLATTYGLSELSEQEEMYLKKAMDLQDREGSGVNLHAPWPQAPWASPVQSVVAHIQSRRSKIGWSTSSHSGTAIQLSAIGQGAKYFGGSKDNTEVGLTMAGILGFELTDVEVPKF